MTKPLLIATAVIEFGAAVALLAVPAFPVSLLLGTLPDSPVAMMVARVAGAALFTLGLACWLARHDGASRAGRAVIGAMVFYNAAVVGLLAYANLGLGLTGIALWPAAAIHAGMVVWCAISLRGKSSTAAR